MRAGLSLALAYRHVRAGLGRMVLSVAAVALGVALVVAIRLMNGAVLASFLDTVDAVAGRAAFHVTAGDGLTFSEDIVERVAAVPGVRLAVPLVTGVAFPDDESGELLSVYGVDLTHEADVRLYHAADDSGALLDDPILFLSRPDSILLARQFAERRGLTTGSLINLSTPGGVKRFTVRGLLDPEGVARTLGGRLVVMDLYAAERAFTADGQINQIDVVVLDDADVDATRRGVATALPPGLTAEETAVRKGVVRRTIGGFQAMVTAFGLLAVVAGFVICYSRLGAIFEARTWEVGLLRAVGLRRVVVFRELLKESLLLGVSGTAAGIPLGVFIGRHALPFVAAATAINFRLPVPSAKASVDLGGLAAGVAVGLGAATLAAIIPALRLARKQPVAALTMRGREAPADRSRMATAAASGLLIAVVALILWQRISESAALGNVTTALMAVAACALSRPLAVRGSRFVTPAWQRIFGHTGRFAAIQLGRQARRVSLTVATLGLGVGVVLMFGMLGWSFERTLVSTLTDRLRADLVITSAFVSGGYRPAPVNEDLLAQLRELPGVATVAAEQEKDVPYGDGSVMLDAYDANCFHDLRVCRWRLGAGASPDALARVTHGEAVLVSASFAHGHGTRPGDIVRLPSAAGPVAFEVAGVTSGQPVNAVIMRRESYRNVWNDPMVTWVHVALERNTDRAAVAAAIARTLGQKYRLQIRSGPELVEYFAGQARQAFSMLYLMEGIIFLLVLIGIGDTLATSVIERTRVLGMMRAIGLHRSRLVGMVLLEGLAMGLLGAVLAVGVGLTLGLFWVQVQFPAILGWRLDLHFPSKFVIGAIGLTLLLCILASFVPSLRAARLSVPAALRNE